MTASLEPDDITDEHDYYWENMTMTNDALTLVGGWLAVLADRLVREMEDDGITEPLAEPITLAAVLADLFRLAETPTPAPIAAFVGGDA